MKETRFRCIVCGKLTAGKKPLGSDGTFRYPRWHLLPNGEPCPGNYQEAEWIDTERKERKR